MRRWLAASKGGLYQQWRENGRARQRFIDLVGEYRQQFVELYGSPGPETEKREGKAALFQAMGESYHAAATEDSLPVSYHGWFGEDLNNAKLNSVGFYNALVPGLEDLLAEVDSDLVAFYERCAELADLDLPERHRRLQGKTGERHGKP